MIKKFLYYGAVAIVVSLVLFLVSSSEYGINSSYLQNGIKNITVQGGNFSYVTVNLTGSPYMEVLSELSAKANVYLFNGSGFSIWRGEIASKPPIGKGISYASGLEGMGTMVIYQNVTTATISFLPPQQQSPSPAEPKPIYSVNLTAQPLGVYYFVIDNTNGSASFAAPVKAGLLVLSNSTITNFENKVQGFLPLAVIFFMLMVFGIMLLIYGLVKRSPEEAEMSNLDPSKQLKIGDAPTRQQIDELYKNIGQRKRAKRRRNT